MSLIIKNLYLGDIEDVTSFQFIKRNNIQLIINAAVDVKVPEYDSVEKIINLRWKDDNQQKISFEIFDELYELIESYIKQDKTVLVNCFAGISRSSTIVIAYLMKKNKWSFEEAYEFVIEKRVIVEPNENFQEILRKYEEYLH